MPFLDSLNFYPRAHFMSCSFLLQRKPYGLNLPSPLLPCLDSLQSNFLHFFFNHQNRRTEKRSQRRVLCTHSSSLIREQRSLQSQCLASCSIKGCEITFFPTLPGRIVPFHFLCTSCSDRKIFVQNIKNSLFNQ